ncbi:hypothetical protein [Streptomyces sp. CAU 1734]|uniref:hypothetical protein n=1 Tax=Streptomyces sp. CAU 1734 TaxID=3140360 RepID=UPI0032600AA0
MKPLRHTLASALHLPELRHHGRPSRHPAGPSPQERYGSDRRGPDRATGAECPEPDGRKAGQYGTGRSRADRSGTDCTGADRTPGGLAGAEEPVNEWRAPGPAADPGRAPWECDQDPLFEFLRAMHHFLTAPQSAATAPPVRRRYGYDEGTGARGPSRPDPY